MQYARDQLRLLRAETRGENRLNSLIDDLFDKVMKIGVDFNEKYPHPIQELSKSTKIIENAYIIQLSDLHFNKIVDLGHYFFFRLYEIYKLVVIPQSLR